MSVGILIQPYLYEPPWPGGAAWPAAGPSPAEASAVRDRWLVQRDVQTYSFFSVLFVIGLLYCIFPYWYFILTFLILLMFNWFMFSWFTFSLNFMCKHSPSACATDRSSFATHERRKVLEEYAHLLRVFLLRVLESNFPGDPLSKFTDMRIPTP